MKRRRSKALVVVAHPDDETIYFGGLILSRPDLEWHVVCVTDGNADGKGADRRRQFAKACQKLGVSHAEMWEFADVYERRINNASLTKAVHARLVSPAVSLAGPGDYDMIFTHGILGEYGHPHHQDVSFCVHEAFARHAPVMSVAHNAFPDLTVDLSPRHFAIKTGILWNIYQGEVTRFLNLLPASSSEGFVRVGLNEVQAIYKFFTHGSRTLPASKLRHYKWLRAYLAAGHGTRKLRLF